MVLIYNTKLVSPGELTGWESLLSGRWSGSIALANPTVSGSSYTAAATMLCALPGDDWDQLDRLAVPAGGPGPAGLRRRGGRGGRAEAAAWA